VFKTPSRRFAEIGTAHRPSDTRTVMGRAVILGGSMAGLMAARVASDHAEEVLVVEPDDTDNPRRPRPGVPQGSQVHGLLPAGLRQLDRWYPGYFDEAVAAGGVAPPIDAPLHFYTNDVLHPVAPVVPGAGGLCATRPFLESLVRRRTLAIDNVRFIHGRAEGLVFGPDRVTGVRYRAAGADETVTETADLVVDAMGRSSRLSDWLADASWPRPRLRRMTIKLNYATALVRRDVNVADEWVVISRTTPGQGRVPRIGGITAVEGDRWIMLISGYGDDRPTRDAEDFRSRCRNDFPPVFGTIVDGCEMVEPVVTYHQADSRRRDFHELDRLPRGLVAVGDAVASFNPIYGQGMTSAALHASCLSNHLRTGSSPRDYYGQVRTVVNAAWQTSTTADLALPHVDGPYPPGYRAIKWFADQLYETSMTDAVIASRLGGVTTMLAHPVTLGRPGTVLRVAGKRALAAVGRSSTPPPPGPAPAA
jgi:2-polyprenyl-6-methoxyphenol hydroxylase-like FAD-dependent oxidoreductase